MNYVGKTKKSKENNKSNTHNNTVSENHPGEKTPFLSRRHNKNLIDDSESNAVKQTAVKGSWKRTRNGIILLPCFLILALYFYI